MRLELDHIAVAAQTIEDGLRYAEAALGVAIPKGGSHPLMGTHNHLLSIGPKGTSESCFLEIIAPEPGTKPARARWFGLDQPPERPRIVTWILRSPDLAWDLEHVPGATGPAIEVTRGALRWRIGVPEDGTMPHDGAFPTIIQWPPETRPSDTMHDAGCRLTRLEVFHPNARLVARCLAPFFDDARVVFVTAPAFRIAATVATPSGIRELA